jgi:predicted enzyme related to lactoylglutathione lyase
MPDSSHAGVVLYALDMERVATFYEGVLHLERRASDAERVALFSGDFQLIIHAIPAPIAATIVIESPPEPREETVFRLFFTVASLSQAARTVSALGGELFPHGGEQDGVRVRDGCDPEGNIFQLRERPDLGPSDAW